jgi:hypothetical protein
MPVPKPFADEVGHAVELVSKKSVRNKNPTRSAMNLASQFDGSHDPGLLDLAIKSQSSSANANHNMFHGIAGIPPPNAMNQHGLQLTSEVTLFPSQGSSNPKLKNSSGASHRTSSASVSNNSKPSASSVHNPHITIQQSSRGARPSSSSSGPSQFSFPAGNDAAALQALMLSKVNSGSSERAPQSSTSQKSTAGGSRERKAEPENVNPITINPYFSPAMYGKIDPAVYMSLFGPNPYFYSQAQAAAGLMSIPGAMEQLYKDLLLQGQQQNMNNLSNWYNLPPGKDRGNKS